MTVQNKAKNTKVSHQVFNFDQDLPHPFPQYLSAQMTKNVQIGGYFGYPTKI